MIITHDGFIEVVITDEMISRAAAKDREMGELNNSIRNGDGNLCGFLGEEVVLAAWNGSTSQNTYQHDITFEEISFEVKSKDRTVAPLLEYESSVAKFNTRQRADFYVFTSLLRRKGTKDYTKGYVLGIIDKQEYFEKATFLRVGDIDPSNNWKVRADCYNLHYRHLTRFSNWRAPVAA